jgi:hypothetical protein
MTRWKIYRVEFNYFTWADNKVPGLAWTNTKNTIKKLFFLFKVITTHMTILENSRNMPPRKSVQLGRHVCLNVFSILKFLSFECSFHLRKAKIQSRKLGLSWQVWMKSWRDESFRWFCSSVSLFCTDFAHLLLYRKPSRRIWRIVSLLMSNSFAIILRAHLRTLVTISRTYTKVSVFWVIEGNPLLG